MGWQWLTQNQPWFQLLFRLVLGGIYLQSGLSKLAHMEAFHQSVLAYKVLPEMLAHIYADMLPWVEIIAGGYLIIGLFTPFAAAVIGLMTVSFIIAISLVLIRGDAIDCGCFVGGKTEPITPLKLVEDLAYLILSVYLTLAPLGKWSVDHLLQRSHPPSSEPSA